MYMLEMVSVEMPKQIAEQLRLTYVATLRGEHPRLPAQFSGTYSEIYLWVEGYVRQNGLLDMPISMEMVVHLEVGGGQSQQAFVVSPAGTRLQ